MQALFHYKRIALLGIGAVGQSLAIALHKQGLPVSLLINRSISPTIQLLAKQLNAALDTSYRKLLGVSPQLVFLCVPDDALAPLAASLARLTNHWHETIFVHVSGMHTTKILHPLKQTGASTLSFHPLQSFARGRITPFDNVFIALEGDEPAVELGKKIVKALSGRYLVLSKEAKTRYHVAASIASNHFVTLVGLVNEVALSIGLHPHQSFELFKPLITGTWENLQTLTPEEALTGPVVRGDFDTILKHFMALAQHLPHLLHVYASLSAETVRLGVRSGRLSVESADQLLAIIHEGMKPPSEEI